MGKYDAFLDGGEPPAFPGTEPTATPTAAPPPPAATRDYDDFLEGGSTPSFPGFDGPDDDGGGIISYGKDLLVSYGIGANALLGLGGTLYGLRSGSMDNWATRQAEFARRYYQARKSPELLAAEERRKNAIDSVDNEWSKAWRAVWETATSPALFSTFIAEQTPMLLASGGAGVAAGAGAKATTMLSQAAIKKVAQAGAVTAGGALSGADAAQSTYEQLKRLPDPMWMENDRVKAMVEDGIDPEVAIQREALRLSRNNFAAQAVISVATNVIPGAMAIEKKLVGAKVKPGTPLRNAMKGAFGEAVQEGIEEGSTQLLANLATQTVDPTQPTFENVGENFGMGTLLGPLGGLAAYSNRNYDDMPVDEARQALLDDIKAQMEAAELGSGADVEADITQNDDGSYTATVRTPDGETSIETNSLEAAERFLDQSTRRDDEPPPPPSGMANAMQAANTVLEAGDVDAIIGAAVNATNQGGLIARRRTQQRADAAVEAARVPGGEAGTMMDHINRISAEMMETLPTLQVTDQPDVIEAGAEPAAPPPQLTTEPDAPREYFDARLKRQQFRDALTGARSELVKGGGIDYLRDESGKEIIGRTASSNPEWFQSLAREEGVSVADVQKAIDKALAGQKLGVRQERVVRGLLDMTSEERAGGPGQPYLEELRAYRDRRAFERARDIAPSPGPGEEDVYLESFASMGELFEDETYAQVQGMDVDPKARQIYDLSESVDAMGGDAGAILDSAFGADDTIVQLEREYARLSQQRARPVSGTGEEAAPTDEVQQEATEAAPAAEDRSPLVDLFGEVPVTEQALADEERRRDEARNTGTTDMTGTLFGEDRQQVDIADIPSAADIEEAANEAATSDLNDLPEPTEAQKSAGNYKKGEPFNLHGLNIRIENPRGSTRSGTAEDGTEWSSTMGAHYGDIKRTEAADGDNLDVFVGENPESQRVWVIDQIDQQTGEFDEHKIMLGFATEQEAMDAYLASYDQGWRVGPVTATDVDTLREWIQRDEFDNTQPFGTREEQRAQTEAVTSPETQAEQEVTPEEPQFTPAQAVMLHEKYYVSQKLAEKNRLGRPFKTKDGRMFAYAGGASGGGQDGRMTIVEVVKADDYQGDLDATRTYGEQVDAYSAGTVDRGDHRGQRTDDGYVIVDQFILTYRGNPWRAEERGDVEVLGIERDVRPDMQAMRAQVQAVAEQTIAERAPIEYKDLDDVLREIEGDISYDVISTVLTELQTDEYGFFEPDYTWYGSAEALAPVQAAYGARRAEIIGRRLEKDAVAKDVRVRIVDRMGGGDRRGTIASVAKSGDSVRVVSQGQGRDVERVTYKWEVDEEEGAGWRAGDFRYSFLEPDGELKFTQPAATTPVVESAAEEAGTPLERITLQDEYEVEGSDETAVVMTRADKVVRREGKRAKVLLELLNCVTS